MTGFDPDYARKLAGRITSGKGVNLDQLAYGVRSGLDNQLATGDNDVSQGILRIAALALGEATRAQVLHEVLRQMIDAGDDTASVLHWLLRHHVPLQDVPQHASSQAAAPVEPIAPQFAPPPLDDDEEDGTTGDTTATAAAFTDVPEGAGVTGSRPTQPTDTEPSVRRRRWFQGGDNPSGNSGTTGTTSANLR
jgi:hypothetical protein